MNPYKYVLIIVFIVLSFFLSACGGGNGSSSQSNHEPIASFSTNVNSLEIIATDTSFDEDGIDDIVEYNWECSDGFVSTEKNLIHVFKKEGVYIISHYVVDKNGSKSQTVKEEVVVKRNNSIPIASFHINVDGLQVVATNTSYDDDGSDDIISYHWESSDGWESRNKDFFHVFSQEGTYEISLVVEDSHGVKSKKYSKNVTVKQNSEILPLASFSVVVEGLKIVATYDGASEISEYYWSISDGCKSSKQELIHTFSSPGEYEISLVVKDVNGLTSEVFSKKVVVSVFVVNNHIPVASFKLSSNSLKIVATNTSTDNDGASDIVSYSWTSSDGGSATTKDYFHTFATPGTYTISLVVTDSKGASSAVATKTLKVEAQNNVPVASFTVTNNYLEITATNTSTDNDGASDIVSYYWTSSDGGSATTKDYFHTFATPGTYTISLVVTDSKGAISEETSQSVMVNTESIIPIASFNCGSKALDLVQIDNDNSYYSERITCLIDGDVEPSMTYSWNIVGDGVACNSPIDDNSVYECKFSKNTDVNIELIVSNSKGDLDKKSISYTSSDVFRADFYDLNQLDNDQYSPIDGFVSNPTLNAEFVSNSVVKTGGDYTFVWDFGDGLKKIINQNSNIPNTMHSYLEPTVYKPVLTIRDNVSGIETKVSKSYYYFSRKNCSNELFKDNYSYNMYYMYYLNNGVLSYVLVNNAKDSCIGLNDHQCPSSLISYYDDNISNDISEISYGGHSYTVSKGKYGILKYYTESDTYGYNGNHQLRIIANNKLGNSEECVIDINIANRIDELSYEMVGVGDLVQFGAITTLNNQDEIVKNVRPIIWEVVRKDDQNKRIMLLQTYDNELLISYDSSIDNNMWSDSYTRLTPYCENTDMYSKLNNQFSKSGDVKISFPQNESKHVLISFNEHEKQVIDSSATISYSLWTMNPTTKLCSDINSNYDCLDIVSFSGTNPTLAYNQVQSSYFKNYYLFFLDVSYIRNEFSSIISKHWHDGANYYLNALTNGNCPSRLSWEHCFQETRDVRFMGVSHSSGKNTYHRSANYLRLATWIELSD